MEWIIESEFDSAFSQERVQDEFVCFPWWCLDLEQLLLGLAGFLWLGLWVDMSLGESILLLNHKELVCERGQVLEVMVRDFKVACRLAGDDFSSFAFPAWLSVIGLAMEMSLKK